MIVLKFGSSVLRSERDLPAAVHEIYRHVREGRRVVAVVSAIGSTTDDLLAEAQQLVDPPCEDALAAHLATGEARSVALLALALGQAGIACTPVDACRIRLATRGPALAADPVSVDVHALRGLLAERPVVVAPGFVGVSEDGRPTLLGRGGSDLTAVFLAHRLGRFVEGGVRCRLIKDVDGVYTADPHATGSEARRYETLAWSDAVRVGGRIVQERALEVARDLGVTVEVAQANASTATVIGAEPTRLAPSGRPGSAAAAAGWRLDRPLRIGLLGLGVVGRGVYERVRALPERFELVRVAVRDVDKHRQAGVPPELLTCDPWEVLDAGPDVVVELIGGRRPAAALIEAALADGRAVVTANKDVVARHGAHLREVCDESGGELLYSAAVGGAASVLEAVRQAAAAEEVVEVRAAVSGTCNFILDRVGGGAAFEAALQEAQRRGLAEADPTTDVSGADVSHKIAIIAHEAFGAALDPDEIPTVGIERFAREIGRDASAARVPRLVGICRRDACGAVSAAVSPQWLEPSDPLAQSRGEEVVCQIVSAGGASSTVVRARGAGRWPTAESVVADLLELARRGGWIAAARPPAPQMDGLSVAPHARASNGAGLPPVQAPALQETAS